MISGKVTAPTHPSQATDDPNHPMYDFQDEHWEETPDLFDSERGKTTDNNLREITNRKYREIGDVVILHNQADIAKFHNYNLESQEIIHIHSNRHMLPVGDRYLCNQDINGILKSRPST